MANPSSYLKEKSPYIRIEVGEETPPLRYKSWQGVTSSFGKPVVRYSFEIESPEGYKIKTFDNGSQAFSDQMAKVPFNAVVIISRHPKLDKDQNPVPDKSIYKVRLVGKVINVDKLEEVPGVIKETADSPSGEGTDEKPGWVEEILHEES